jgi:multiple sugar transport system ATP-binding protein
MARVVIENLTKVFAVPGGQGIRAVDNLSLCVEDREFLVLVGPSGCGKTTTLRLIAGLEDATQGTISIAGKTVDTLVPKARDVAMVFQHPALYPHMSAYDNIAFGLMLRKCPRSEIERRVREAAELLGLNGCLPRLPHQLSGGQRQRVSIGRAIVRRPSLFLFDEPLSNLDAPLRAQMREEIARLQAHLGATMIYVTHDQVEAMSLGDRVAIMKSGAIQQIGQPMDLYRHPVNPFVANFIGSLPMNFCS